MSKSSDQANTQDLFNRLGYCKARAPKTVVSMLPIITQYLRFQKDKQSPKQDSPDMYNDSLMEALLLHLTPFMQEITGVQYLLPTYSLTRIYRNHQQLPLHTDRPSCEISATLFVACNYQDFNWPIFMDNTAVYMEPGDLVVYRGQEVPHCRPPLISFTGESIWHMQTFFHYVRANGPLKNFAFDQRPYIGFDKHADEQQTGLEYR